MALNNGFDAVLLYKLNGAGDVATWVEANTMMNCQVNYTKTAHSSTARLNAGVKTEEPVLSEFMVTGTIQVDDEDTHFTFLQNAMKNNSTIGIHALNAAGGSGPKFTGKIHKWEREEPEDGLQPISFEIKPCRDLATPPAWADDERV